jgi:ABC-type sugar transport system ATPase subunit
MILSAEKICKRYGEREILKDVSLKVRAGQCVLLRGPSGGGKSTLLRILALLEPADSGYVLHDERRWEASVPLSKVSSYPFLTVVFQQLFLWPNLTMAQNLSIVLGHHPNAPLPPIAIEMLERFTIAHLLARRPHECSLGERQRLALARSLLSDALFLLLDEPSSALDRANRSILIQELTTATVANRGVLLITHDDHGFDEIADQSFELENGRLEPFQ